MDDAELLRDWRAGDAHAGDALVSRYFPAICRFFRSKLGDDVDDLIQRTFLDCLHGQHGLRVEGSFRSFLFTIAYRRLYDHLRERAGPTAVEIGSRSLADLRTTPSRAAARGEEQALVLRALERIELDHRVVLELAYWEEMSGPEIAAVLGIAANTVRSRLSRGRAALREQLAALQGDGAPISEDRLEELTRGVADG
jgi:RNA polymerase sigma factor (sigma-70 family)